MNIDDKDAEVIIIEADDIITDDDLFGSTDSNNTEPIEIEIDTNTSVFNADEFPDQEEMGTLSIDDGIIGQSDKLSLKLYEDMFIKENEEVEITRYTGLASSTSLIVPNGFTNLYKSEDKGLIDIGNGEDTSLIITKEKLEENYKQLSVMNKTLDDAMMIIDDNFSNGAFSIKDMMSAKLKFFKDRENTLGGVAESTADNSELSVINRALREYGHMGVSIPGMAEIIKKLLAGVIKEDELEDSDEFIKLVDNSNIDFFLLKESIVDTYRKIQKSNMRNKKINDEKFKELKTRVNNDEFNKYGIEEVENLSRIAAIDSRLELGETNIEQAIINIQAELDGCVDYEKIINLTGILDKLGACAPLRDTIEIGEDENELTAIKRNLTQKVLDVYSNMVFVDAIIKPNQYICKGCGELVESTSDWFRIMATESSKTGDVDYLVDDGYNKCPKCGTLSRLHPSVIQKIKILVARHTETGSALYIPKITYNSNEPLVFIPDVYRLREYINGVFFESIDEYNDKREDLDEIIEKPLQLEGGEDLLDYEAIFTKSVEEYYEFITSVRNKGKKRKEYVMRRKSSLDKKGVEGVVIPDLVIGTIEDNKETLEINTKLLCSYIGVDYKELKERAIHSLYKTLDIRGLKEVYIYDSDELTDISYARLLESYSESLGELVLYDEALLDFVSYLEIPKEEFREDIENNNYKPIMQKIKEKLDNKYYKYDNNKYYKYTSFLYGFTPVGDLSSDTLDYRFKDEEWVDITSNLMIINHISKKIKEQYGDKNNILDDTLKGLFRTNDGTTRNLYVLDTPTLKGESGHSPYFDMIKIEEGNGISLSKISKRFIRTQDLLNFEEADKLYRGINSRIYSNYTNVLNIKSKKDVAVSLDNYYDVDTYLAGEEEYLTNLNKMMNEITTNRYNKKDSYRDKVLLNLYSLLDVKDLNGGVNNRDRYTMKLDKVNKDGKTSYLVVIGGISHTIEISSQANYSRKVFNENTYEVPTFDNFKRLINSENVKIPNYIPDTYILNLKALQKEDVQNLRLYEGSLDFETIREYFKPLTSRLGNTNLRDEEGRMTQPLYNEIMRRATTVVNDKKDIRLIELRDDIKDLSTYLSYLELVKPTSREITNIEDFNILIGKTVRIKKKIIHLGKIIDYKLNEFKKIINDTQRYKQIIDKFYKVIEEEMKKIIKELNANKLRDMTYMNLNKLFYNFADVDDYLFIKGISQLYQSARDSEEGLSIVDAIFKMCCLNVRLNDAEEGAFSNLKMSEYKWKYLPSALMIRDILLSKKNIIEEYRLAYEQYSQGQIDDNGLIAELLEEPEILKEFIDKLGEPYNRITIQELINTLPNRSVSTSSDEELELLDSILENKVEIGKSIEDKNDRAQFMRYCIALQNEKKENNGYIKGAVSDVFTEMSKFVDINRYIR